ncbi:hypothetical protein BDZ97DRAFT_642112 [Flammula alnicola]|nr:hypothetical protein BDZ97DRAFT_642112 [Flammula alnicola]
MDHQQQLANAIREKTSVQDALPLAATVQLLNENSTHTLDFDASHLLLTASPSSQLSETTKSYLYRLAKDAQDAAYSIGCSSVLVGQGNEGDDTGDVAFWLGEGEYGAAENVLRALGLGGEVNA